MNIWQNFNPDRIKPEDFVAFIEIEKGSKNKYELDKESGLIILDRVLYTSTHYPMNYGFIPLTYSEDNDPLDVFVLCSEPIEKMSLVRCYPIGVIEMLDRNENDTKIIAIPFGDPQYNTTNSIEELPKHVLDELQHFLTVYKQLENKTVSVKNIGGPERAKEIIVTSMKMFNDKFSKN
ncbi:MAG: inorganic diphosphatase [Clostridia bacterium]